TITDILQTTFRHYLQEKDFNHVFFYGAGLSAASQKEIIREVLQSILPDKTVHVHHDMTAAARSTHREKGIVCILGTGSNSALHEGFEITENLGGHGYMFGDEGSGADLGKHFIKHLLQNDFPASVKEFVEGEKGAAIYEQKIQIMKSERPNVDLAEYSVLISKQIHVPEVRKMVYDRFIAFLDTTVCRYPGYESLPVDFVGSISFFFQNILEQACKDRNVQLGSIVKDPVDNLIAYHLDRINEESL
ncbi:MAG: ATPase, partial [Bacteroidota bacterium]